MPSPMDTNMLMLHAAVVCFALIVVAATWWLVVVPWSRKDLAIRKRRGEFPG